MKIELDITPAREAGIIYRASVDAILPDIPPEEWVKSHFEREMDQWAAQAKQVGVYEIATKLASLKESDREEIASMVEVKHAAAVESLKEDVKEPG